MRYHKIHCQEPWFSLIKSGVKPVEGRKNSLFYQRIHAGDTIEFFVEDKKFLASVIGINRYNSIDEYLRCESLERALPGVKTIKEGVAIYLAWNRERDIANIGFLGIQVMVLSNGHRVDNVQVGF